MKNFRVPLVLLCLGMFTIAGCGGKDEKKEATEEKKDATSQTDLDKNLEPKHNVSKPVVDPATEEKPVAPAPEEKPVVAPEEQPQPEAPVIPAPTLDVPEPAIESPILDPAPAPAPEAQADPSAPEDEASDSTEAPAVETEKEDISELFGEEPAKE